jgi:superfamily I DNA and/or RNA helicase
LHKNEPPKVEAQRYARWKAEVESIQNEMRKQAADALRRARLAAMTTTGAAFRYDDLRQQTAYDLVVFDEASQVSIVHALSLVGLGKHILFAGDPRQLAPVVKSEHPDAKEWLGKSPFERMPADARYTCLLDEQSRMADRICELVSRTFYGGRLKVAADKRNDPEWLSEREPFNIQGHGKRNAYLVSTDAEAKYSQKMGGWIRYETAQQIVTFVDRLTDRLQQDDILVITPYRAQRTLIRQKLRNAGYKRVHVSTVHRAQGSERDTVIFDPVAADNPFLNNEDLGPRLINVAVSRAKARIILFASPENRRNPFISQIAAIIENSDNLRRFDPIHQFISRTDFPNCIFGKTVGIQRKNGTLLIVRVTGLDPSGTKLNAVNCSTGAHTSLSIEHLKNSAGSSR